ncbi:hypothetical protein PROVRUST_06620 [Providencia rustigianii DSM 4541]|uniref:Uncharacterized protein n=1 Tax=Providencia rustigianii DSM 4541 TaxID=500637 RepID=D1P331_9GAMM|nr:hypothetical protein PROVRUST_06620 [Providencia rustigianii DSM 4541]
MHLKLKYHPTAYFCHFNKIKSYFVRFAMHRQRFINHLTDN